jgi:hypothetical protein
VAKVIHKAVADIENADLESDAFPNGGFTAVLTTPSVDRDGDELQAEDWNELPDRIPIDIDHGMTVATTVGSGHPYWDETGKRVMIDVAFSSIPRAQETRTLVKEGHIRGISVAFLTDRTKKDGTPRRELLNAGIVAIPSNRDAVILDAKSVTPEVEQYRERDALIVGKAVSGSLEDLGRRISGALDKLCPPDSYPWTRATFLNDDGSSGTVVYELGGDTLARDFTDDGASVTLANDVRAVELTTVVQPKSLTSKAETKGSQAETSLIQGIHDAACHLGATCAGQQTEQGEPDPDSGADDGANSKSTGAVTLTIKPELDMPAFQEQLEKLTALTKSSGDEPDSPHKDDESAPADAASEAASEQEPAAEESAEAAVDNSDEVAEKQAAELMASLLDSDLRISQLIF